MKITPLDGWISQKIASHSPLQPAALAAYQLEKLQATLDLARSKSPFYREKFKDLPVKLASLQDFQVFPFTSAQDLRESGQKMVCVSQDEINRVVTLDTSGTTGTPKRLYFTQADQELTIDFFRVGMSIFTHPGDRVLILLPGERPGSVGDLLAVGLQRLGAVPIPHGVVRDLEETLAILRTQKVDGIVGIPNQVLALARTSPDLRLKSVLLSTDHVPATIVKTVAKNWHCQVYNHYGMTEMGLGGGVECAAHLGYHLREADLYFEVIDPLTGQPVPDGSQGEVVFTTLTRSGMPLIRYRTCDLSRFLPAQCTCGSSLRLLEKVKTRLSGQVSLGCNATICLADLDEVLFAFEEVYDFSVYLEKRTNPTEITFHLVLQHIANPDMMLQKIKKALLALPAVSQSVAENNLVLQIQHSTSLNYPIQPQKRKIEIVQ
ncbi:MAG: AMP-binding protein [Anaerolineaceae bacterium]|nr:AMP-binding protein [Anaerolineaceae bacterium]